MRRSSSAAPPRDKEQACDREPAPSSPAQRSGASTTQSPTTRSQGWPRVGESCSYGVRSQRWFCRVQFENGDLSTAWRWKADRGQQRLKLPARPTLPDLLLRLPDSNDVEAVLGDRAVVTQLAARNGSAPTHDQRVGSVVGLGQFVHVALEASNQHHSHTQPPIGVQIARSGPPSQARRSRRSAPSSPERRCCVVRSGVACGHDLVSIRQIIAASSSNAAAKRRRLARASTPSS